MTEITLTEDQKRAMSAFAGFLANDSEEAFVLAGYSGTGKSTLVTHLLDQLPKTMQTIKLIKPDFKQYEVSLTATTNKAAENFSQITGNTVGTIQSFLGLVVQTDYKTQETKLVSKSTVEKHNHLLFIDEASYIDSQLLTWIFKKVKHSKIVFIGDPAQLTPVKAKGTPVFDCPFPKAQLTQVVRQAEGNPIVDLSTKFRNAVVTGQFFNFTPDGQAIRHMDRASFNQAIADEFCRPDWKHKSSKILAWTNRTVIAYNKAVGELSKGRSSFQIGDYALCNDYFNAGKKSIKTDETVLITGISETAVQHGVTGRYYHLNGLITAFAPDNLADKKEAIRKAKAAGDLDILEKIDTEWIDLRSLYACTINKSQGSTYDRVFIDLDDIKGCNSGDQIARMLYVGVSRARQQVFLTGDLV